MKNKKRPPVIEATTIRARRLELVDERGDVRGLFETIDGQSVFTLFSPIKDGPRLSIATGKDDDYGYVEIAITDPQSERLVTRKFTPDYVATWPETTEPYTPLRLGFRPRHDSACGYDPNPFIEIGGLEARHAKVRMSMTLMDYPKIELTDHRGEQRIQIAQVGKVESRIALYGDYKDMPHINITQDEIVRFDGGDCIQEAHFGKLMMIGGRASRERHARREAARRKYSKAYRADRRRGAQAAKKEIKELQEKGALPKRPKKAGKP